MVDQVELRSELLELAERCERATKADMGIDADIERTLGMARRNSLEQEVFGNGATLRPKRYSGSLDAAMTLVPNNWRVRDLTQWTPDSDAKSWSLELRRKDRQRHCVEAEAATAALALCAAALRARTPTTPERSDD